MNKLTIDIGCANLGVEKYDDTEFVIYLQDKRPIASLKTLPQSGKL